MGVELLCRPHDDDLRTGEEQDVAEERDLPQVILRARSSEQAGGGAHHRRRLPREDRSGHPREPVDRVLEDARNREVVLGGHDQKGVRGAHALGESRHGRGDASRLDIAVVERDRGDVEGLDDHPCGRERHRRAQESAVERSPAQASGAPRDVHVGHGSTSIANVLFPSVSQSAAAGIAVPEAARRPPSARVDAPARAGAKSPLPKMARAEQIPASGHSARTGKGSGAAAERSSGRAARRDRRQAARESGPPQASGTRTSWVDRGDGLALLLLLAACILVYANTLGNEFVWDDRKQILENDLVKEPRFFAKAMVTDVWGFKGDTGEPWSNYWRPVFILWLIGNYRAFGVASTGGWHCANIALHALAVALAYVFLRRLGLTRLLALAVTLPFAVHPIHVESVSWISGSPDMLVSVGLLGALILLLGRLQAGGSSWSTGAAGLVLALVLFAVSLLSKEITIFFPAIIFVTALLAGPHGAPLGERVWTAAKRTIPFVVLTGVYAIAHFQILGKAQIAVPWQVGPSGLVLTAPRIFFYYLRQAFLPLWIAPAYPVRVVTTPDAASFLVPAIVVVPVIAGLVWLSLRDTVRGIGLALFLVPLLPAFNISAFAPDRVVADRYLYLPSLGPLMILVPSIAELVRLLRRSDAKPAELVTFWIFAAAAALLGLQTILYNRVWKSELTLWTAAIAADPTSPSALNEYARLMYEAKRYADARSALDRAITFAPLTTAHLLRADVAIAEKRYADAEADIKKVLNDYPSYAGAYERLALAYQNQGRLADAEAVARTAITKAPHRRGNFTDSLGVILYLEGRREEALQVLEAGRGLATTELNPGAQSILFHLGMLYMEMGRAADARQALEEYLRVSERSTDDTSRSLRQQSAAALTKLPR